MSRTSAINTSTVFSSRTHPPGGLLAMPGMPRKTLATRPVGDQLFEGASKWLPLKNPLATFENLPTELKHQIYKHLFHPPSESTRPCEIVDSRTKENTGCHCGESLSLVSRELYGNTRALFYNCASFVFQTPELCQRFIKAIGNHCAQVGSLEINYANTVQESSLLQGIFESFRASSKLVHLEFIIKAREEGSYEHLPIYVSRQTTVDKATLWDLEFRPMHHPLADLKALRKLTIRGHPGISEMEEVLFRACKNVENLAVSQQRYQRTVATWTSAKMLSYSIESISGMEREYSTSEPCSPADSQAGVDDPFDGLQW